MEIVALNIADCGCSIVTNFPQRIAKSIQHMFINDFYCFTIGEIVLHHYKKYLAVAGVGAAMTAVGLALFVKTKKEEKHGCCH
jgi:hypothetical protein